MAKIPFNIKYRPQIESGEYKVEFDGKPARIICWDKKRSKDNATIVALIDDGESEHTEYFFSDGMALCATAPALRIITPDEELTEFENAFGRAIMEVPEPEEKEEWYQFLKEKAAELLSLARKEVIAGEREKPSEDGSTEELSKSEVGDILIREQAICEEALDTFGMEHQVDKCIEECAELINALEKYRRGRALPPEVVTEIADVMITCAQMSIVFGRVAVVHEEARKLKRLEKRIEKARNGAKSGDKEQAE